MSSFMIKNVGFLSLFVGRSNFGERKKMIERKRYKNVKKEESGGGGEGNIILCNYYRNRSQILRIFMIREIQ